jgi:CBS-domain-containing membrane protein
MRKRETCVRHILAGNGTEVTQKAVIHFARTSRARRPEDPAAGIGFLVAADAPISTLMSRDILCVREDLSADAVRALLLERGIGAAPVVDAEGMPLGIITKTDLVRGMAELGEPYAEEPEPRLPRGFHLETLPRATARDLMMPFVFALPIDTSVAQAAAFMASRGVHHVIVVDKQETVVGLFSTIDIARWLAVETGFVSAS